MAEDQMNPPSDAVERRILLALETAPRPEIPADFAARVGEQLPPRDTVILTPGRYGHGVAMVCLAALLMLMLAFAHRATGGALYWLSLESIFCVQFALLAVWLGVRGYTSASSF
jgi:hypothetical protein